MNNELTELFNKYQAFTQTTAIYPEVGTKSKMELIYLCLGLLGEHQEWKESNHDIKEAGDVLWYLSQLCTYYESELSFLYFIAEENKDYKNYFNIFEALKKSIRDNRNPEHAVKYIMEDYMDKLKCAYSYSINNPPLDETFKLIIMQNIDKLTDRKNRDMLRGDGDLR